jgi:hypothetical protein
MGTDAGRKMVFSGIAALMLRGMFGSSAGCMIVFDGELAREVERVRGFEEVGSNERGGGVGRTRGGGYGEAIGGTGACCCCCGGGADCQATCG